MSSAFEKSVLEFSLPLYQALDKEGNVFMSPYSVSAALMLLLLGTDGDTKTELETALNLQGQTGSSAHEGYNSLQNKLCSKSENGVLVAIANRLFSKLGVDLKTNFTDAALKYYGSEVQLMDFENKAEEARIQINSWIEKQTRDKIKDLLTPNLLTKDTMMVLTNAIYFKGDWELKFDEGNTSRQPFHVSDENVIEVDMMFGKKKVMSGEFDELDCKCLQLPYKGNTLSMLIILPNKKMGLTVLESNLTVSTLQKAIDSTYKQETNISIPKFKIEATFDLTKVLPELGITKIFDTKADFGGIYQDGGKDVYVSDAIHKAFVEVNEEGTEAAAATALVMTRMMMPLPPFEFKADHPFLFLIRENESGTILFMGRYSKPT
ncbi:Serpin B6,Leukocyte elastase inhibitor [Mytilus coruscus]|uniref:Serpin B6,Leukocyte elastase inhibitor n=1 Tax=Mytilus coruscus TaxID=42192 RepID=A0A6J8CF48_MYTCO|nr:Serpin B6,Leukocyte elastase inhibitor [Mytilus coruscus]